MMKTLYVAYFFCILFCGSNVAMEKLSIINGGCPYVLQKKIDCFFKALEVGNAEELRILIQDLGVQFKNDNNLSSLFFAVQACTPNDVCIKILLSAGADPYEINHLGLTPLHCAVTHEQVHSVRLFLDESMDPNAYQRGVYSFESPTEHEVMGVPQSLYGEKTCINIVDLSPLHSAALARNKSLVEMLLRAGACPNSPDKDGFASLDFAMAAHCFGGARSLILAGARSNYRNIIEWVEQYVFMKGSLGYMIMRKKPLPKVTAFLYSLRERLLDQKEVSAIDELNDCFKLSYALGDEKYCTLLHEFVEQNGISNIVSFKTYRDALTYTIARGHHTSVSLLLSLLLRDKKHQDHLFEDILHVSIMTLGRLWPISYLDSDISQEVLEKSKQTIELLLHSGASTEKSEKFMRCKHRPRFHDYAEGYYELLLTRWNRLERLLREPNAYSMYTTYLATDMRRSLLDKFCKTEFPDWRAHAYAEIQFQITPTQRPSSLDTLFEQENTLESAAELLNERLLETPPLPAYESDETFLMSMLKPERLGILFVLFICMLEIFQGT